VTELLGLNSIYSRTAGGSCNNYDADLDYLIQAKYDDDGNNSWDETVDWTYDTAGNRASDTSNSGSWTYDYLSRMSASPGVSYTNDILGNRTFMDKTGTVNDVTYTWDALNRLITYDKNGGARHYAYRADGMRVSKVRGSGGQEDTTYRYDGQMLMEEYFAGTEYPRDYLQVIRYGLGARGIDYIERVRTQSGTLVGFPLYDGHGNMIGTLARDATSGFTVGDTRRYGAWGDIRTGNATGEPNPRYCANLGHVQDDESGLIYMRARYYEPASGRFISEDPGMQGSNWFVYCLSNPVNYADGSGQNAIFLLFQAMMVGAGFYCGFSFGAYLIKEAISLDKRPAEFKAAWNAAFDKMVNGAACYVLGSFFTVLIGSQGANLTFEALLANEAGVSALGALKAAGVAFGIGFAAGFLTAFYMGAISMYLTMAAFESEA
jgi:RHS repeat-associated protein